MSEDSKSNPKAPYMPYTTFTRFLSSLKAAGAVPARIDKSLMNGHSGSMQSWMIASLKFFELIDDGGHPQPDLEKLIDSEGEARSAIWRQVFERAYKPVIDGLDLMRATSAQLDEKFGSEFTVETKRKCAAFFSAGAVDAGIPLSAHLKPKSRGAPSGSTRKPTRRKPSAGGAGATPPVEATSRPKSMQEMLADKFPAFDANWPDPIKEKWFAGFQQIWTSTEKKEDSSASNQGRKT
jgi:hypothetical protein